MTMIKICGVSDVDSAYQAAKQGADFIGLVFHPKSTRHVTSDAAKLIVEAIRLGGAIPVAVFVHQIAETMIKICEDCDIQTVQLHGPIARHQHQFLPSHFTRFYTVAINTDGKPLNQIDDMLKLDRDYLLFDSSLPGRGSTIKTENLHTISNGLRYFLAGGLSIDNVKEKILAVQPDGVDVSSGVETLPGKKCQKTIKQFIHQIKETVHDCNI